MRGTGRGDCWGRQRDTGQDQGGAVPWPPSVSELSAQSQDCGQGPRAGDGLARVTRNPVPRTPASPTPIPSPLQCGCLPQDCLLPLTHHPHPSFPQQDEVTGAWARAGVTPSASHRNPLLVAKQTQCWAPAAPWSSAEQQSAGAVLEALP